MHQKRVKAVNVMKLATRPSEAIKVPWRLPPSGQDRLKGGAAGDPVVWRREWSHLAGGGGARRLRLSLNTH